MKYSQWIGVLAAVLLIISCFMPWAFYPDLQKEFTGFFSEKNIYGKPGKLFVSFSIFAIIFFITPKTWAKRWNLLITALSVAFAIRTYIVFSGCYSVYCPEKRFGLWLMLGSSVLMLVMSLLPTEKIENRV